MLTGREIVENNLIGGYLEENIQQVGVDLRVDEIFELSQILEAPHIIPDTGKTVVNFQKTPLNISAKGKEGIILQPGYYEVRFTESCNLGSTFALDLKTRSSVVRCGGKVHNGMFDPGFNTENIGCFLEIKYPIQLFYGSRIAQAIVFRCNNVDNMYNGQWQNS